MKTIPLTRGLVALVDDEDYEALSAFKWHAGLSRSGKFYAARKDRSGDGQVSVVMHGVVISAKPGEQVDHIHGNTLDNRKSQLRICSKAQNMRNRGKQANNTSGLKGVYRCASKTNPWQAAITAGDKTMHLGVFKTREAAARAYYAGALKHYGEFARLNFPLTTTK